MTPSRSTQRPVDPRGMRFAAGVSTTVLFLGLVTGSAPVLAAQTMVFALGAFAGLRWHPYRILFRYLVAPRLTASVEWEDPAPIRFAQGVGFVITIVGALGFATGLSVIGATATAAALGAAFLNAAFGLCLACELYLRLPPWLRGSGTSTMTSTVKTANTERGAAA